MMRYGETVRLDIIDRNKWNALIETAKIYELKLPSFPKVSKLIGETRSWKREERQTSRWNYQSEADIGIWEVTGVWTNLKKTVKVVLAGKGWFTIFSKSGRPAGFTSLMWNRYSDTPPDIFDNLKIGSFLCVNADTGYKEKELLFIVNEPTPMIINEILDTLEHINKIQNKTHEFKWKDHQCKLTTYGTVSLKEVKKQLLVFNYALRNFKWKKRKNIWDLMNAVKANLSIKNDGKELKVKIKALDGNIYTIETPVIPKEDEQDVGWDKSSSLFKTEFWLEFVYREKNDAFLTLPKAAQTDTLFKSFLTVFIKVPESKVILGFNRRRVVITRKKTSNKATLNYLDGKIVRTEDMAEKIKEYFIYGKPIITNPQKKSISLLKQKKTGVLSSEAQALIEKGLNGIMRDLEGEFPFHLNTVYKAKRRKWYIEIAGKEFYIKGGYNALSKVRSAIAGYAITNNDKEGYDGRDTKAIRYRLGELVGDKNALWIIIHVKKMGALYKAMGAGEEN